MDSHKNHYSFPFSNVSSYVIVVLRYNFMGFLLINFTGDSDISTFDPASVNQPFPPVRRANKMSAMQIR